jgi:hypothetical protein
MILAQAIRKVVTSYGSTEMRRNVNPNPHCFIAITKAAEDEKIHFSPTPCTTL